MDQGESRRGLKGQGLVVVVGTHEFGFLSFRVSLLRGLFLIIRFASWNISLHLERSFVSLFTIHSLSWPLSVPFFGNLIFASFSLYT